MKQILIFKIIITAVFLFSAASVFAAELKLSSPIPELGANQQFQVDLILDTQGEEINAIEGKIAFPENLLEIKEIRDGNSIINFWIERPSISQMVFSGIIPGGYLGEGFIFSAIFQTKKEGEGIVGIQDAKILLNDGSGTSARLSIFNFQFNIKEAGIPKEVRIPGIQDNYPPEEFKPEITQNAEMFGGKYFLVFATQDKGAGIDHYEVCEGSKRKCAVSESPYVLKDQKLKSYIYVKAVDKAGNERIITVPPQNPLKWYEKYLGWSIITLIAMGYAIKVLWRRFIRSR
jgi:hypothetical protein